MRKGEGSAEGEREVYFSGYGQMTAPLRSLAGLEPGEVLPGPALVESPLTTIVVEPGTVAERAGTSLVVRVAQQHNAEEEREIHGNAVNG